LINYLTKKSHVGEKIQDQIRDMISENSTTKEELSEQLSKLSKEQAKSFEHLAKELRKGVIAPVVRWDKSVKDESMFNVLRTLKLHSVNYSQKGLIRLKVDIQRFLLESFSFPI
jgi:hypothetical protein